MNMRKRKNKGFTLIELIATLGILSIVLAAVFNVLDSGNKIYIDGIKKDNVQNSARLATTVISQAIKTSRICILADGNPNFNGINGSVPNTVKKLLFVESTDGSRFMYVIERNSTGLKELHKISFSDAIPQQYILTNPIVEYSLTDYEVTNFPTKDTVNLANITDRVDYSAVPNFLNVYFPDNAKLLYENYGDRCYLCVRKHSDLQTYKLVLSPVDNTDYNVVKDDKICDFIDAITVQSDSPITDVNQLVQPVTSLNIYKLNIQVKTIDREKKKELTTSSYILNYRGGL